MIFSRGETVNGSDGSEAEALIWELDNLDLDDHDVSPRGIIARLIKKERGEKCNCVTA